jgi:TatD DNase family protein
MIRRFREVGGKRIYLPNIDVTSIPDLKMFQQEYSDICYPMMGLHPCAVEDDYLEQLMVIKEELYNGNYVGVGEIGIDHYWDKTFIEEQEKAFRIQIEWARELKLPFVIHSRDSLDLTIDIVTELQNGDLRGIFHCFNGTLEQAKRIMNVNFMMGIGGVVTFKNAGVDKVVKQIPLDYLVLETDAPYLSPVPFRGKRNEPGYLTHIVDKIVKVKETTLDDVLYFTRKNSLEVFSKNKNKIQGPKLSF